MNRRWRQITRLAISGKLMAVFTLLIVIGLIEVAAIWWQVDRIDEEEPNRLNNSGSSANQPSANSFDKSRYSINDAGSLWALVNKGRKLPAGYVPENLVVPDVRLRYSPPTTEMRLRADAARALEELFAAAANEKIYLRLSSGYRSYSTQAVINAREVRTYGQAQADRQSAKAGHSEHQTGLAADLAPSDGRCEIADCFADTAEGKWLAANAYKFGLIVRYPPGKEALTGYKYEPWHFRFVGKDLAAEISKTNQTLEQFFAETNFAAYPANIYELR